MSTAQLPPQAPLLGTPLGPQPDLVVFSESLKRAGVEAAKFANLPPIAQGHTLLEAILQFQRETQQFQREMQRQITDLERALHSELQALRGELRTSRQAVEHNTLARIENTHARTSDTCLTPFRSAATNEIIPDFPRDSAALLRMTATQLDPVLRLLDLPTNGNLTVKRKRLGDHIGLHSPYMQ